MTRDSQKERLARIDDLIIFEVLSMSDAEIRAEVPDSEIEEAQRRFERAAGGQRSEEVKSHFNCESVLHFDQTKTRSELKRLNLIDKDLLAKLSMAARNLDPLNKPKIDKPKK